MANLLYTELRTDDYGNQQYNPITNEQTKITNNVVLLNELPYEFARVSVTPPDDSTMVEIDIRQPITNANQYKVNYNSPNAVVYFHPDREDQTMTFDYTGMGLIYIDGSRVVTLYENGTIKETLNQLADALRQTNQNIQDNETAREAQFGQMQTDYRNATHTNIITWAEWTFTATTDNTTEYDLNVPQYNPLIDDLRLLYEGMELDRDVNYTLVGTHITLGWVLNNGEQIVHRIIKGVNYTPQPADASLYPAHSMPKEVLALDAYNAIQSVGNKDNLLTNDKTSLVNAINENVTQLADITTNKLPLKANQTDLNTTNDRVTNVENNKRDKSVKLVGNDLDTSSDANKLKLINLSDEVKQAMAGTTPINASIADKGVTSEKYADHSISFINLKNPTAQVVANSAGTTSDDYIFKVDLQAKTITVLGNFIAMVNQIQFVANTQTLNISSVSGGEWACYLNTDTGLIGCGNVYVDTFPANHLILFYMYKNHISSLNKDLVQIIDATGADVTSIIKNNSITYKKLETPMASILKSNTIEVNLKTKVLTVNSCLINIPNNKSGDTFVSSHTVDITSVVNDLTKKYTFYYNFSTSKVEFGIYSSVIPISSWVLFTLYQDTLVALNPKSVKLINTSGTEVNLTYNSYDYDEIKQRILLPDDMYFVKDLLLPIYKSSFISNAGNIDIFKTALINIQSDNTPQINYFDENYLLDGVKLNNAFKIAIAQKRNADYDYLKNVTKHFVDSVANIGKTLTHLCIGDSITEHNIAPLLTSKMATWSVGVTQVGTFNSQEGRSGWRWKNFIGMSNMHADNVTVITRSTSGTTTRYQNPFLKLATADDKTNHPTWCFRNTGAETEKSYATDTDKTGDFYIFDFAWYLSSHSITAPNTITIALGTNDVWHDTDSLANSRLALEIMIKQIKAALPNVKIGIIPSPSWEFNDSQNNNNYWNTKIGDWIDNCITDVKNLQSTYSNLYIIGIWAHMSRFFIWDYDTQANLSSINNTQKCHKLDAIHHGEIGKAEYINAMSSWLMNII